MSDTPRPTRRLALAEEMTVYRAAEHKALLLEALAACERLELDLSGVPEIDTAGLQLLILVKREALVQDKTVSLSRHSAAVRETIEFCNLAASFGDPMLIPAGAPA